MESRRLLIAVGLVVVGVAVGQVSGVLFVGTVTGGSMEPEVSNGDLVVFSATVTPAEGDMILFDSDQYGGLTTHRLISKTDTSIVTQGDANLYPDAGTTPDRIRATAIGVIPVPDWVPLQEWYSPTSYEELEEVEADCPAPMGVCIVLHRVEEGISELPRVTPPTFSQR